MLYLLSFIDSFFMILQTYDNNNYKNHLPNVFIPSFEYFVIPLDL